MIIPHTCTQCLSTVHYHYDYYYHICKEKNVRMYRPMGPLIHTSNFIIKLKIKKWATRSDMKVNVKEYENPRIKGHNLVKLIGGSMGIVCPFE